MNENESLRWSHALLAHIPGRAGVVDASGVLVCANAAWRDSQGPSLCSGWQFSEGLNYWSVWMEFAPHDARERVAAWRKLRRTRFEFEYYLDESPDTTFHVVLDKLADCDGYILIHEREKPLEGPAPDNGIMWTSDELYDTILNGFRGGVFDADLVRGKVAFNPQWFALVRGLEGPPVLDLEQWKDFAPHDDTSRVVEKWEAFARNNYEGSFQLEHRLMMEGGESRWVLTRGRVISRDAQGRPLRMVGTQADITDRKALHEQRSQMERMEGLGRMAHGVSHDFNNLLTVMLMQAELLGLELGDHSSLAPEVDLLRRAIDQATALTRQILAFARRKAMSPCAVKPGPFVSSLTSELEATLGAKHSLVTMTSSGLWSVYVDPEELRNVLEQMVLNARQAMGRPGEVTLVMRNAHLEPRLSQRWPTLPPGDYVQFTLRDTGRGMDETTVSRVFEPFFSTKGNHGLGLATCYGIIRQFGGDIQVQSVLGQGTVFDIMLPRAAQTRVEAEVEPVTKPEPVIIPGSHAGNTVLLVEDEQDVRHVAERLLLAEGYAVWSASNAAQALALIESHGAYPDLLLTDVMMPGMSGIELAEHLRQHRPDMPVAYISGFSRQGVVPSDRHSVFLSKPFTTHELQRSLAGLFDSR